MPSSTMLKGFILSLLFFLVSCNGVVKEYNHIMTEVAPAEGSLNPSASITYTGDSLTNIAFPVGGIGTGNLLLGGRGNILENEIFGKASQDELPPYMSFFAIRISGSSAGKQARILEGELPLNSPNPFGIPREQLGGLPRFGECRFVNEFPFAKIQLNDPEFPLTASLESWNPFIPLDSKNSGIPVAVFDWTLENTSSDTLESVISFNYGNPFCEKGVLTGKGKGEIRTVENEKLNSVVFELTEPFNAEVMIASATEGTSLNPRWPRGYWWDNAEYFWSEFTGQGATAKQIVGKYSFTEKNRDVAGINTAIRLLPGEKKTISYYVFWRIPSRQAEPTMTLGSGQPQSLTYRNFYTVDNHSVEEIALKFLENEDYLRTGTRLFHDLLFSSTFPIHVKDALSSNLASLKTNLIMRNEDGKVHAFEGLGNDFGCCPGNCTHVWNYAQSLAFLFPDLERDMRETNFLHDTHFNGYQSFRTVFPPGDFWFRNYAADGQMGTIIRACREWKFSGDTEWLKKIWPGVKSSLEFAWKAGTNSSAYPAWTRVTIPLDPGKTGVISGEQHNTYDINFYGPNPLTGFLYLGALKAASEMAMALGEKDKSEEYNSLWLSGRENYEKLLWNGEYYEQKVVVSPGISLPAQYQMKSEKDGSIQPKYQFGSGCLSDQLLGQFLANTSGLGLLLDSIHTRRAIQSVYRNNFIPNFRNFENLQRIYALNRESGLVLCTWPNGNKPLHPFVYSDEVWTGVEYQVASVLIDMGMAEEGLEIVKAVRNRYRGFNRNPMAEIESGRYYARAMSSYGLLLSLSGYNYNGIGKMMSFDPKISQEAFFTFWSTGQAWGSFEIRGKAVILKVLYGRLKLKSFSFVHPSGSSVLEISEPESEIRMNGNQYEILFPSELILDENSRLLISLK